MTVDAVMACNHYSKSGVSVLWTVVITTSWSLEVNVLHPFSCHHIFLIGTTRLLIHRGTTACTLIKIGPSVLLLLCIPYSTVLHAELLIARLLAQFNHIGRETKRRTRGQSTELHISSPAGIII